MVDSCLHTSESSIPFKKWPTMFLVAARVEELSDGREMFHVGNATLGWAWTHLMGWCTRLLRRGCSLKKSKIYMMGRLGFVCT